MPVVPTSATATVPRSIYISLTERRRQRQQQEEKQRLMLAEHLGLPDPRDRHQPQHDQQRQQEWELELELQRELQQPLQHQAQDLPSVLPPATDTGLRRSARIQNLRARQAAAELPRDRSAPPSPLTILNGAWDSDDSEYERWDATYAPSSSSWSSWSSSSSSSSASSSHFPSAVIDGLSPPVASSSSPLPGYYTLVDNIVRAAQTKVAEMDSSRDALSASLPLGHPCPSLRSRLAAAHRHRQHDNDVIRRRQQRRGSPDVAGMAESVTALGTVAIHLPRWACAIEAAAAAGENTTRQQQEAAVESREAALQIADCALKLLWVLGDAAAQGWVRQLAQELQGLCR